MPLSTEIEASDKGHSIDGLVSRRGDYDWGPMVSIGEIMGDMLIKHANSREETLRTLCEMCRGLGITGEEIAHYQKEPDADDEAAHDEWVSVARSFIG